MQCGNELAQLIDVLEIAAEQDNAAGPHTRQRCTRRRIKLRSRNPRAKNATGKLVCPCGHRPTIYHGTGGSAPPETAASHSGDLRYATRDQQTWNSR